MRRLARGFNPALYFIIDPACCAGRDVVEVVGQAVLGGVSMVQYRDKSNSPATVLANAKLLKQALQGTGIPLLINDHVAIALEAGADGVHIGQGDVSPSEARKVLGPDSIIGLTAFTETHIAAVDAAIVDYIGTGPVYPTQTDKGKPVLGIPRFADLVQLSPVPVVGIGGITPKNALPVINAGAAGIAVMRGIGEAADARREAQKFLDIIPRLRTA